MRPFHIWLAVTAAAILAGIAVPYVILSGGETGGGVFYFWTAFGIGVIALVVIGLLGWRR